MNSRFWLAGGFALLLLLGCMGVRGAGEVGGNIGDSDISAAQQDDSDLLPAEELIPSPSSGATVFDDSDFEVEEMQDTDLIAEGDIIEPI